MWWLEANKPYYYLYWSPYRGRREHSLRQSNHRGLRPGGALRGRSAPQPPTKSLLPRRRYRRSQSRCVDDTIVPYEQQERPHEKQQNVFQTRPEQPIRSTRRSGCCCFRDLAAEVGACYVRLSGTGLIEIGMVMVNGTNLKQKNRNNEI